MQRLKSASYRFNDDERIDDCAIMANRSRLIDLPLKIVSYVLAVLPCANDDDTNGYTGVHFMISSRSYASSCLSDPASLPALPFHLP